MYHHVQINISKTEYVLLERLARNASGARRDLKVNDVARMVFEEGLKKININNVNQHLMQMSGLKGGRL